MSMSKKDFIALADELRPLLEDEKGSEKLDKELLLSRLCCFMYGQNAAFKEDRWRSYLAGSCGPNGGKVK